MAPLITALNETKSYCMLLGNKDFVEQRALFLSIRYLQNADRSSLQLSKVSSRYFAEFKYVKTCKYL